MHYWVYENYPNNKAMVHRAECSHCKDGAGVSGMGGTSNGQWLGPYPSAHQAGLQADSAGRADIRYCAFCKPQREKAMTTPTNPAPAILPEPDWQRLSDKTQEYVQAGYELMGKAGDYFSEGDLRQASEKGWGAAAQLTKAVAENWRNAGVTHGRHQDLRTLVHGLSTAAPRQGLLDGFRAAESLHENFYENNDSASRVDDDLQRARGFVNAMLPYLAMPAPPPGFRQGSRRSSQRPNRAGARR